MAPKQLLGVISLTTPMENGVVKVRITRHLRPRLYLAYHLTRLVVWIAGGETRVEIED